MKTVKAFFYLFVCLFFIPHLLIFAFKRCNDLKVEVISWGSYFNLKQDNVYFLFLELILKCKEFRSVFYFRIGRISNFLKLYSPGVSNLYIMGSIGSPFFIVHGYSTYIHVQKMGANCRIWHNVTIGKKEEGDGNLQPTIGSNVKICTGAIVLGDIKIGDNVTIGAGSIVIKDVPDNCIVVGNPARVIKYI